MAFVKGGKPGPGRIKGVPNKANADLRAAAQKYTPECLKTLAKIMQSGESEQARIAAANSLLDRAHGKPPQALTGEDGAPLMPATVVHEHIQG